MPDTLEYLTVAALSQKVGITRQQIYLLIKTNKLKAKKDKIHQKLYVSYGAWLDYKNIPQLEDYLPKKNDKLHTVS